MGLTLVQVIVLKVCASAAADRARAAVRHAACRKSMKRAVLVVKASQLDKVPYHKQGNEELSTADAFHQRQRIRRHHRVLHELDSWWTAALDIARGVGRPTALSLREEDYVVIYQRLAASLHDDTRPFDRKGADADALEEWQKDSVDGCMNRFAFMDCIFECADLYVRSVDPADYALFLRTTLDKVLALGKPGGFERDRIPRTPSPPALVREPWCPPGAGSGDFDRRDAEPRRIPERTRRPVETSSYVPHCHDNHGDSWVPSGSSDAWQVTAPDTRLGSPLESPPRGGSKGHEPHSLSPATVIDDDSRPRSRCPSPLGGATPTAFAAGGRLASMTLPHLEGRTSEQHAGRPCSSPPCGTLQRSRSHTPPDRSIIVSAESGRPWIPVMHTFVQGPHLHTCDRALSREANRGCWGSALLNYESASLASLEAGSNWSKVLPPANTWGSRTEAHTSHTCTPRLVCICMHLMHSLTRLTTRTRALCAVQVE